MKKLFVIALLICCLFTFTIKVGAINADDLIKYNNDVEIFIDGSIFDAFDCSNKYYLTKETHELNRKHIDELILERNRLILEQDCNDLNDFDFCEQMRNYGFCKMEEDQAKNYMNSIYSSVYGIRSKAINENYIVYPEISGLDFYISYCTEYDNNNNLQYLADVIVVPSDDRSQDSKLVVNYDSVNMYTNQSYADLANKVIGVSGAIISSLIPHSGAGLPISVILALLDPIVTQPVSSSAEHLSLSVSSVSTISHIWKKENGRYAFKLATNSAILRESWLYLDNRGEHHYTYNEEICESYGYRSTSIAANQAVGTSTSYDVGNIKYQIKGFLWFWTTKLSVRPYYAGSPLMLATN